MRRRAASALDRTAAVRSKLSNSSCFESMRASKACRVAEPGLGCVFENRGISFFDNIDKR